MGMFDGWAILPVAGVTVGDGVSSDVLGSSGQQAPLSAPIVTRVTTTTAAPVVVGI